jgi:hypothetical protein
MRISLSEWFFNQRIPVIPIVITALVFSSATTQLRAEMLVGGYIGGVFGKASLERMSITNIYNQTGLTARLCHFPSKSLSPSVLGGLRFGGWLKGEYSKYFGLYGDLAVSKLNYSHCFSQQEISYTSNTGPGTGHADINFVSRGHAVSLAFMVACRTFHRKSEKYPNGQLRPYLALGPAFCAARECARVIIGPHEVDGPHFGLLLNSNYTITPTKKASRIAACVALDLGLEQQLPHSLTLDYGFNYRYSPCRFCFCSVPNGSTGKDKLEFKNRYHMLSVHLGLSWYF